MIDMLKCWENVLVKVTTTREVTPFRNLMLKFCCYKSMIYYFRILFYYSRVLHSCLDQQIAYGTTYMRDSTTTQGGRISRSSSLMPMSLGRGSIKSWTTSDDREVRLVYFIREYFGINAIHRGQSSLITRIVLNCWTNISQIATSSLFHFIQFV